MSEILTAKRYMDPEEQGDLALAVYQETGITLGSLPMSILGPRRAATSLVNESVYATHLKHSYSLRGLGTEESRSVLRQSVLQSPTESDWLTVTTTGVDSRISHDMNFISYLISSRVLMDEKERLNDVVSDLADRIPSRLNLVHSRLVVAVLPDSDRRVGELVEKFQELQPEDIRLMPVLIQTAAEARVYEAAYPA